MAHNFDLGLALPFIQAAATLFLAAAASGVVGVYTKKTLIGNTLGLTVRQIERAYIPAGTQYKDFLPPSFTPETLMAIFGRDRDVAVAISGSVSILIPATFAIGLPVELRAVSIVVGLGIGVTAAYSLLMTDPEVWAEAKYRPGFLRPVTRALIILNLALSLYVGHYGMQPYETG